jgi:hydrogenase maturation factor
MSEIPEIGKISADIFSELIFPKLGAKSGDVLVGPMHGIDVGISKIGDKAVSFTCDPVFIVLNTDGSVRHGLPLISWLRIR